MCDLDDELGRQEIERLRDAGDASGSTGELDMLQLRRNARTKLKAAASLRSNAPRHTRA
jgi:hypothetical protein